MVGEAAKWPKTVWEGPKWSRRAQNAWDIFERQKWLPNGPKQSGRAQNGLGGPKMSGTLSAVYARVYGPNSFMWCGGARGKVPNIEKCLGRALLA